MITITQTRSTIGAKRNQRETLRSLGLKRIHHSVTREDRPEVRGMVDTVIHMVSVHVVGPDDHVEVGSDGGAESSEGTE